MATQVLTRDADREGAFWWIGTSNGTGDYVNPVNAPGSPVAATFSSQGSMTPITALTDRATSGISSQFFTNNAANSWVQWDLGTGYSLVLNEISLRQRDESGHHWRGITIAGSNDGSTWTDIQSITSTAGQNVIEDFAITSSTPYRYFRLTHTTGDSSGQNYFTLGEIELFGTLTYPVETIKTKRLAFDTNRQGIMWWIGTNGDTESYTKPATVSVTASSTLGTAYPDKAFDRNGATIWHSNATGLPAWIQIDLGSKTKLAPTSFSIRQRYDDTWHMFKTVRLSGSNDGSTWTDIGSASTITGESQGAWRDVEAASTTPYRYLRVSMTELNNLSDTYFTATEIDFFGTYTGPIGPAIPPAAYAEIPFTARLNELAGTTGLSATGAANVLAGTSGLALQGALNVYAETQGISTQGVLNILAGTTDIAQDEAARRIGG